MIIGLILHGRPTVMRRLLIRSKRRVLIASDYLERALRSSVHTTKLTGRNRSRPPVPCREVVSRNRNERSGCSRVDTGNWARTGRDRWRPVRKSVVWTRPMSQCKLRSTFRNLRVRVSRLVSGSCDRSDPDVAIKAYYY